MRDTGIWNLTNDMYQADPAISNTDINLMGKSMAHYKAKEKIEPTKQMIFGTAFHEYILQPGLFDMRYAVAEYGMDPRTKAYKAWAKEQEGKILLSHQDMEALKAMKDSLQKNKTASAIISDSDYELSHIWNHPKWGFRCRSRPDVDKPDLAMLADLKTTTDCSAESVARAIANFGYHRQAAWYLTGAEQVRETKYEDFIFIFIEKAPPYAVATFVANNDMVYLGSRQIQAVLERYVECLESDIWPGPPDKVQVAELPQWYVRSERF